MKENIIFDVSISHLSQRHLPTHPPTKAKPISGQCIENKQKIVGNKSETGSRVTGREIR